jgi:hypothetical protein
MSWMLSISTPAEQGSWDWKTIAAIASPLLALLGVIITGLVTYRGWRTTFSNNAELERQKYENSINLEKQKTELAFVSDQIRYLYGPLWTLYLERAAGFNAMMTLHARGRKNFFDGSKLTSEDLRQWRLWRIEVLIPIVLKMEETIVQNAHLMEGTAVPESFRKLLAHVAAYKAVIKEREIIIDLDKGKGKEKKK